jgi:hypothetical protein
MNIFPNPIARFASTTSPAYAGRVGDGEPKMLAFACVSSRAFSYPSLHTQGWAHFDRTIGFTIDSETNTGRSMV